MDRILVGILIAVIFGSAWFFLAEDQRMRVVGQPVSTGRVQSELERPFFESLARMQGLGLRVDYKPASSQVAADDVMLNALKQGKVDLVSLRMPQLAEIEPGLVGLGLPGQADDHHDSRRMADAYAPVVKFHLQQKWGSRLLGLWSFGPQVLICKDPVRKLADLKGIRVRVASQMQNDLITGLQGIPVRLAFDKVAHGFAVESFHCAISSIASASAAGGFQTAGHVLALQVDTSINGYAVSEQFFSSLSQARQNRLEQAFAEHTDAIWKFASQQHDAMIACARRQPDCLKTTTAPLFVFDPAPEDLRYMREVALPEAVAQWEKTSTKTCPNCVELWRASTGNDHPSKTESRNRDSAASSPKSAVARQ